MSATGTLDLNSIPRFMVSINPNEYSVDRLTLAECRNAVSASQVRYRGWYFPHIQPPISVGDGAAYIFNSFRGGFINDHLEEWRLYRSGQFLFKGMVWEYTNTDFQQRARDDARYWDVKRDLKSISGFLEFRMLIALVTEAYTFAARLAQAARYDDALEIEVGLRGVKGYGLASNDFGIHLHDAYPVQFDDPHFQREIAIEQLIGDPWGCAREATLRLFEQFGWLDAVPRMVEQHQHALLR